MKNEKSIQFVQSCTFSRNFGLFDTIKIKLPAEYSMFKTCIWFPETFHFSKKKGKAPKNIYIYSNPFQDMQWGSFLAWGIWYGKNPIIKCYPSCCGALRNRDPHLCKRLKQSLPPLPGKKKTHCREMGDRAEMEIRSCLVYGADLEWRLSTLTWMQKWTC